jgi:hypothetical protein
MPGSPFGWHYIDVGGGDGGATPSVCRATSSLSGVLTLFVVEAGASCRDSSTVTW